MSRRTMLRASIGAILLILAGTGVWLAADSSRWPVLGVVALAYASILGFAYLKVRFTAAWVLAIAVLLRITAFPLAPALSDDAYRYVWDGELQREGINPYAYTPEEAFELGIGSAELIDRMNSARFYSVYPPFSQIVFRVAADIGGEWPRSYYVLKAILVLMEMAGVLALLALVRPGIALLYAWNPLVVMEVAGQAHTEAAAAGALLVLFWALRRARPAAGGVAFAVAIMTKLYPIALAPLLAIRSGWRTALATFITCAVLALPYLASSSVPNAVTSLRLYAQYFEFNAGLYYAVKWLGATLVGGDISKTLGPSLAMAIVPILIVLTVVAVRRKWSLERSAVWILGGILIMSTTVHPWYLVPVLAAVAASGSPGWHWQALALASLGTYSRYVDGPYGVFVAVGWTMFAAIGLMAYGPDILKWLLQRRGRRKAQLITPHLTSADQTLLDLGTGEGFVGERLSRETGRNVHLADIIDQNRTGLPFTLVDEERLPFDDRSFDAVILSFVLHHAADPGRVIAEAARVSRHRLIVLESVFRSPFERRLLFTLDILANRMRGAWMRDREHHLEHRTAEAWQSLLEDAGLTARVAGEEGSFWHRRAIIVAEHPGHAAK